MFLTFWRHKTLSLLKNVEIHQYLCNVVPYLEIEVNFCLFPMCSGPDNCHFQLHLKLTFLHAGMCVNNRKSSGFLVSVFKHSTLMCHEGTFVWQNPIQTINALLWFLEICRGNGGKLLNHQSLNQFSGRVSWLCACTHVFLCLNQSCIFPQNHWITLLQVQTNSTSVNDCQILPLLLSGFTANTVIFFLCFSVRHICVGKCFWKFGSDALKSGSAHPYSTQAWNTTTHPPFVWQPHLLLLCYIDAIHKDQGRPRESS